MDPGSTLDDVDVSTDHFDHVHFGDQINHLLIGVTLFQHLDSHGSGLALTEQISCIGFHYLQMYVNVERRICK